MSIPSLYASLLRERLNCPTLAQARSQGQPAHCEPNGSQANVGVYDIRGTLLGSLTGPYEL